MSEIVIVPTYQRDPLLYLCLEAIRRENEEIEIAVWADRSHDSEELRKSCDKFEAVLMRKLGADGFGNSWNVIHSLRWASNYPRFNLVHLIEDDTIVHKGYFEWARVAVAPRDTACAIRRVPADPKRCWYESPCATWKSEYLRACLDIVPENYFQPTRAEMQVALDRAFPNSKYMGGNAEQDGFLLRCLEHFGWKVAYPTHVMASHIGFVGYNRPIKYRMPRGTFEEQIAYCRKILHSREKRGEMFGHNITTAEMEGMLTK